MNLNQLRYLTALADVRSFSQAAKQSCVTQPTLSNGIAQLEKHLGGKLFKRTTRSVVLTKFGEFVLPMAQAVLEAKDELEHSAQAYFKPETRILRIGMSPLLDSQLLSSALASFEKQHDWTEIFLKQCFLDDLVERLENETLDLALLPQDSKKHKHETSVLYEEDLFYLPPNDDVGSSVASNAIELKELRDHPIILTQGCGLSDVIEHLFEGADIPLTRYPGQALSYSVVEEWSDLGIAGGILPRSKLSKESSSARPILKEDGAVAKVGYEAVWMAEDMNTKTNTGTDAEPGITNVETCARHLSTTMRSLSMGLAE